MGESRHVLLNRGADLLSLGNAEEAERCFSRILENEPDHLPALFNSAIALGRLDRFRQAEERMKQYLQFKPADGEAWNQLGYLYFSSGSYGEAAKAYNRAEEIDSENATLQNNIGALQFVQGRHEQALHRFEKALEIDKSHQDALFNIADTLDVLGRGDEAKKYRRKLKGL